MLLPHQQSKLARGAKDKEHAMSQTAQAAIAVIGIDIGKNSFHSSATMTVVRSCCARSGHVARSRHEVYARMRRDGGSVFPAPANTDGTNGPRGLFANEIASALISMMARSTMPQSKAGYIDARPLPTTRRNSLATHGWTIHSCHKRRLDAIQSPRRRATGWTAAQSVRVPSPSLCLQPSRISPALERAGRQV